ncbi:uncharacterized protein LOC117100961 [Anneissia japonica]|uniref:uncharacterized protein LOC117100961 n=1 Tax=Anneissia japonica TaxID=1529436 RepID=UPI001425AC2C|nr:uncharacterized protein LOC117100961 [Anneissia japonica]
MSTQDEKTDLLRQRRTRKGALTRLLNTMMGTIEDGEADRDAVKELLEKSQKAFDAVEAIHNQLTDAADDEEADIFETWMDECHTAFWKARTAAISLAENSYDQKVQLVKLKRLCFRCLAPGHVAAKCTKKWTCKKCGSGKHHETVHPPPRSEASPDQQITSNCTSSGGRVYLRILPVVVTTYTGIQVSTLALLDQGSDASLCSESLRKQLGVRGERIKYKSTTINGDIDRVGFKFELTVKGKYEDQVMPVDFLSVPKIPASADSRPRVNDLGKWSHLNNLPWEDYEFDEVGLMIGSDAPQAFWVLEERKSKRKGNSKDPYAVKTLLGWSVMGPGGPGRRTVTSHHIQVSNQRLLEEVQMSWE